ESTTVSRTLTRGVAGLVQGTYTVRVRDAEEGYLDTTAAKNDFTTRAASLRIGRIGIDFIEVFDEALPPTIDESITINDNAIDSGPGGTNQRYIQLVPGSR